MAYPVSGSISIASTNLPNRSLSEVDSKNFCIWSPQQQKAMIHFFGSQQTFVFSIQKGKRNNSLNDFVWQTTSFHLLIQIFSYRGNPVEIMFQSIIFLTTSRNQFSPFRLLNGKFFIPNAEAHRHDSFVHFDFG